MSQIIKEIAEDEAKEVEEARQKKPIGQNEMSLWALAIRKTIEEINDDYDDFVS